jgi:hypothetical protein
MLNIILALITGVLIVGYFVLVVRASRGSLRSQRLTAAVLALYLPILIVLVAIDSHGRLFPVLCAAFAVWYLVAYVVAWWRDRQEQNDALPGARDDRQVMGVPVARDRLIAGLSVALVIIGGVISLAQIVR